MTRHRTYLVVERRCHTDGPTGEVGVEVLPLADGDARGGVAVSVEEVVDVVLSSVTAQDDVAQIGRCGAIVGGGGSLLVGEGLGEVVEENSLALEHVSLSVGAV